MLVDQPDTGGGNVILSVPVKLTLKSGANSLTFGAGQSSKFPVSLLINTPVHANSRSNHKIMPRISIASSSIRRVERSDLRVHVCKVLSHKRT